MTRDPVQRLLQAAETAMNDDPKAITFVQGLALGALVGAAVAGSTIWQRRHARLSSLRPAQDSASESSAIVLAPPSHN